MAVLQLHERRWWVYYNGAGGQQDMGTLGRRNCRVCLNSAASLQNPPFNSPTKSRLFFHSERCCMVLTALGIQFRSHVPWPQKQLHLKPFLNCLNSLWAQVGSTTRKPHLCSQKQGNIGAGGPEQVFQVGLLVWAQGHSHGTHF